jgi:hypothetical protein
MDIPASRRAAELAAIEAAVAAGRCHRITEAEAVAYDEAAQARQAPGAKIRRAIAAGYRSRAARAGGRSLQ